MKGFYDNVCSIIKLTLKLLGILIGVGIIIGLLIYFFTLKKLLDIYGSYESLIRNILNIKKVAFIYLELGFFFF